MNDLRSRILYVDRDEPSRMHELRLAVLDELRQAFAVDAVVNLTAHVIKLVQEAEKTGRPYAAIVTHLPPNRSLPRGGHPYSQTFDIITTIAESTDAPIIAFTGAARSDIRTIMDCVDLVFKGEAGKPPAVALRETLACFVARPCPAQHIPPPVVTRRDGSTIVETIVNLRGGLQVAAASQIARLAREFTGSVTVTNLTSEPDCPVNAKELMSLLMLAAEAGHRIEIAVSGLTTEAERLVQRIYAAVTCRRFRGEAALDRFVPASGRSVPLPASIMGDPARRHLS